MCGRLFALIASLVLYALLTVSTAFAQVPDTSAADKAFARGEYSEARDGYRRVARDYPRDAAVWGKLAQVHTLLGEWVQAVEAFGTLDRLEPLGREDRIAYADALREAGRLEEAIQQYNQALEQNDNENLLARAERALATGDTDAAINLYWEVIGQDRESGAAWCGLGRANSRRGLWTEAVQAFEKSDELGGLAPAARQDYGDALRETGDLQGALVQYNYVVSGDEAPATPALAMGSSLTVESPASTLRQAGPAPVTKAPQPAPEPMGSTISTPAAAPVADYPAVTPPSAGQSPSFKALVPADPTVFYQSRAREVNVADSSGNGETDPEPALSPSQWLTRARDHADNDEWEDAVGAYQHVLDGGIDDIDVRLEYANALREVDQIGLAKMEYNRILHEDAANIDAKLGLAKVIAQDGDLEEAMYLLDQLAMNPDAFARARLARAWCYLVNDYTLECWRDIGDLLAMNPANSHAVEMINQRQPNEDTWGEIKSLLLGVPGNEEAVALIEEIMEKEQQIAMVLPDDPVGRADALYHRGRYDEARREYERLVQRSPMDSRGWLRLGNLYVWDEDWEEAIAAYEQYLTMTPGDYEARLHYAQALMWSGDGEAAVEELESLINDVGVPIDTYEQALLAYAVALSTTGRAEEARRWFEDALVFLPHSIEARVYYASSLASARAFDEAIAQYRIALKEDPTNEEAKLGLAQAYAWKGDNKMARQLYDELNIGGKKYTDAQVGKAYTYLWEGDRATAAELADEIALLEPDNPAVAQLQRELNYVGDAKLATTVTMSHDRDDNDYSAINTLISVPVDSVGSQLTITNEDFKLDNTGRNEESAGVHTRLAFSTPVGRKGRFYGNAGYLDIDNGSAGPARNWTWGTAYRVKVNPYWNFGIGYNDHVLYDTTELARNEIKLREWSINSDWQVFDRNTRLFTQASYGDLNDGNERTTWTVNLQRTALWYGTGKLNYGLAFRGLDYRKDLASGYWDPDNYRYGEVFMDWFDQSNNFVKFDGGAGWGFDDASSGGGGSVFRYYAGLRSYLIPNKFEIKAGFKGSESSSDDITGPGYEMRSWYLTGEYTF